MESRSQEARAPADKCADYLPKNKKRFDYATALANGWPIAIGIIEGACRHLVKDRMVDQYAQVFAAEFDAGERAVEVAARTLGLVLAWIRSSPAPPSAVVFTL